MATVFPPSRHRLPRRRTLAEVAAAGRTPASWWTVMLFEGTANRLVRLLVDRTPAGPNDLTALSVVLTIAAAGGLLEGGGIGLTAGALLFQLSFLVDCMDGRLARLTGTATELGAWFAAIATRARFMLCTLALLLGQYARTEERSYLFLLALVIFCYAVAQIAVGQTEQLPDGLVRGRSAPARAAGRRAARPRTLNRPVTEVEFGVAVCVVAPLTGVYVPVIAVAAVLLLIGELATLGGVVRLFLRAGLDRSPLPRH